jgi:hypothetical protein
VGLREGASGLLDFLGLLVEDLLALPFKLPLDESVGVRGRHIVPDVDEVELRTALACEVDRRLARLGRVLGAVGGQKDLRREAVHLCLLSASPIRQRPEPPPKTNAR